MSGSTTRRGRAIGVSAAGALLLALVPVGAAHAAKAPAAVAVTKAAVTAHGSSFLGAAVPANTPSVCSITSYAPSKITIGASTVSKTFSIKVTGCTPAAWAVGLVPFESTTDPDSEAGIATSDDPTISLSPKVLENAQAGNQNEALAATLGTDEDPSTTDPTVLDTSLTLLRRATWGTTLNASPEPVKKGKTITIKGTLTRVNWTFKTTKKMPYSGYSGRSVQLQFKATGATAYTTVKSILTIAGGKASTTVKATKTGSFRYIYAGNSVTGAATSTGDTVKVS